VSALHPLLAAYLAWFGISRLAHLGSGLWSLWIAWTWRHASTDSMVADAAVHDAYLPVSLLVPATGAEPTSALATARALGRSALPEVEIILALGEADGALLAALEAEWDLEEASSPIAARVPASPSWRLLRSRRDPRLSVAITGNGRALSTALGLARAPLVCVVSPGDDIDPVALLRASMLFTGCDHVVAIAGGALPSRAPERFLERLQAATHVRSFFAGGAARAAFRTRLGGSAPFHLLHRESLLRAGGFDETAVDPHLDALVRMGRRLRQDGLPFETLVALQAVGRAALPRDARSIVRLWRAARRGLADVLRRHRGAMLRPRYGKLGWIALPYLWCFDLAAPAVEATGLALLGATVAAGALPWDLGVLAVGCAGALGLLRLGIALATSRVLQRSAAPVSAAAPPR